MASFSEQLSEVIEIARRNASYCGDPYASVEHLLWALLKERSVADVIVAVGGNIDRITYELEQSFSRRPQWPPGASRGSVTPSVGFQRVMNRAWLNVRNAEKPEIGPVNALVALFAETKSYAVRVLEQNEVSRIDVVDWLAHGQKPARGLRAREPAGRKDGAPARRTRPGAGAGARCGSAAL